MALKCSWSSDMQGKDVRDFCFCYNLWKDEHIIYRCFTEMEI